MRLGRIQTSWLLSSVPTREKKGDGAEECVAEDPRLFLRSVDDGRETSLARQTKRSTGGTDDGRSFTIKKEYI